MNYFSLTVVFAIWIPIVIYQDTDLDYSHIFFSYN